MWPWSNLVATNFMSYLYALFIYCFYVWECSYGSMYVVVFLYAVCVFLRELLSHLLIHFENLVLYWLRFTVMRAVLCVCVCNLISFVIRFKRECRVPEIRRTRNP